MKQDEQRLIATHTSKDDSEDYVEDDSIVETVGKNTEAYWSLLKMGFDYKKQMELVTEY